MATSMQHANLVDTDDPESLAVSGTDRFVLLFSARSPFHAIHWCVRDRVADQLIVCVGTEDRWRSFIVEELGSDGSATQYRAHASVPVVAGGGRQEFFYTVPDGDSPVRYGTKISCIWEMTPLTADERDMVELAVRNMNDHGIPVRTAKQRQAGVGGH